MQMAVHKTLYPFYTTKKMPHVTATATKIALRLRSNASFSLMLFHYCIRVRCFTAINSHCLAAIPAKMSALISHMRQNDIAPNLRSLSCL